MKHSDELKRQASDLLDEAERMTQAAERERREFTPAETAAFNANMDKVKALHLEIEAAEEQEHNLALVRAAKASLSSAPPLEFDSTGGRAYRGEQQVSARVLPKNLVAFQDEKSAYDSGLWLKARLLSHTSRHDEGEMARQKFISRCGEAVYASQNEHTPTDGGYAVVPAFDKAVTTYREQVGVARKLCRVVDMGSDTFTVVKQTSGTGVYYPGEEAEITPSDINFSRVTLSARKRAILTYISNELKDDALVSIADLVAQDMGHQFALSEDGETINGDGTSSYGGVLGIKNSIAAATASISQAATNNDTWPELTYADCAKAMSLVSDKFRSLPLAWLCSGPFKWQVFDRLTLAQGGSLSYDMQNGVPQAMFAGYPIYTSDRCPTTTAAATVCAYFGAFSGAVLLGTAGRLRIETSPHVGFTTDRLAIRGISRYDIHVHEEGDTSTAGAIVGLKTAA